MQWRAWARVEVARGVFRDPREMDWVGTGCGRSQEEPGGTRRKGKAVRRWEWEKWWVCKEEYPWGNAERWQQGGEAEVLLIGFGVLTENWVKTFLERNQQTMQGGYVGVYRPGIFHTVWFWLAKEVSLFMYTKQEKFKGLFLEFW